MYLLKLSCVKASSNIEGFAHFFLFSLSVISFSLFTVFFVIRAHLDSWALGQMTRQA